MARAVPATGNSLRVALLTPTSVACADRVTATSSWNGVAYSSSVVGLGLNSRRRVNMSTTSAFFIGRSSAFARGALGAGAFDGGLYGVAAQRSADHIALVRRRCVQGRLARGQLRFAFGLFASQARLASLEVLSCRVGMRLILLRFGHGVEDDAIDRAGRHAQFAARAARVDDRVHALAGADDGVDRACLDALGAADAVRLDDARQGARLFDAVVGVERFGWASEQGSQLIDAGLAAGRTLVDVGAAGGDGFGIGTTAVVTALLALRLRQHGVDAVSQ